MIAISLDAGGLSVVDRFYSKLGIDNLETYLDRDGEMAKAVRVEGLPMTLIFGREGRALGGLYGPAEWDSPEAEALIRYYIEEARIWSDRPLTLPSPARGERVASLSERVRGDSR